MKWTDFCDGTFFTCHGSGTRPGENVLDLYGGSGSTLMAAEQTGRKAYLMELDAPYCDVIVERYKKFTGTKAERLPSDASDG